MITLFGLGEFLIVPTVIAQISSLAPSPKQIRSYIGILFLSTASGNFIAYYLMQLGFDSKAQTALNFSSETHLFSIMVVLLTIVSLIVFATSFINYKQTDNVTLQGAPHASR